MADPNAAETAAAAELRRAEEELQADMLAGVIRNDYIGPVDKLPYFSIRNGDESDASSLILRPTIPLAYRWCPITGIPPREAMKHADKFIRVAYVHLEANRPERMTDAQLRKAAICVGAIRAVSTTLYDLTEEDMIPGEMVDPMMTWRPETTGENAREAGLQMVPGISEALKRALTKGLTFTEQEVNVIGQIMMTAIGVIPLQGYSLIMTCHHYLSDAKSQSFRAFRTLEGQFWKGQDIGSWFTDDQDLVRDCCWHKSCHPIKLDLKQGLSCSARIAVMVRKAGCGAAASRLPSLESEMRAANSFVSLMQTVRPMFESYDGVLDYSLLTDTMAVVKAFPADHPSDVLNNVVGAPPGVNTRNTALVYLADVMARNTDVVATAYGFYCAMADRSQTLGTMGTEDTLRMSYALKKLQTQSMASFVAGGNAYDDYAAARAAARQKGEFRPPALKFM